LDAYFVKKNGNIFKFRVDTLEHLHTKYGVKEITTLAWGFIWGGGINQIDRKVCCLGVETGGMGMINIQEFIDSKRIKVLYRILTTKRDQEIFHY
jgi:hypothetical protein